MTIRKPAPGLPLGLSIEIITFQADKPGTDLLIFGAIHGNEICGPQAIQKIVEAFRSGKLELLQGSVTFVPIANPAAYAQKCRYVDANLNRIFRPTKNPKSREAKLANILCPLVDRCDVLLDIHSTTAKGQPFIYLDFPSRNNRSLAKILGPKLAVVGWPQLYEKLGNDHLAFDTTGYAAGQGKDGILIECGQHDEAAAIKIAYTAILNTLRHYNLIEGTVPPIKLIEAELYAAFFRQHATDRLAKKWQHLDQVKKGDVLIFHHNGNITKAEQNSFIIMPKASAPVGDDWLYLGRKS